MPYASIPASVQTFMDHITDLCGQEHANWTEDFNRLRQYTPDHRQTPAGRHDLPSDRRYPSHVAA